MNHINYSDCHFPLPGRQKLMLESVYIPTQYEYMTLLLYPRNEYSYLGYYHDIRFETT